MSEQLAVKDLQRQDLRAQARTETGLAYNQWKDLADLLRNIDGFRSKSVNAVVAAQEAIGGITDTPLSTVDFLDILFDTFEHRGLQVAYFVQELGKIEQRDDLSKAISTFKTALIRARKDTTTPVVSATLEISEATIATIDETSHVRDFGESGISLFDIADMSLPLTEENKRKLDLIFTSFSEDIDAEQARAISFLYDLGILDPLSQSSGKKNQSADKEAYQKLDRIHYVMHAYLREYFMACLKKRFSPDTYSGPEDVFPPEANLLPIVMTRYLIDSLGENLLPTGSEALLRQDFIPGLSDEEKQAFITHYRHLFQSIQEHISPREDTGQSLQPYALAEATHSRGAELAYLQELVQRYSTQPVADDNPLADFLKYYPKLRAYLGDQRKAIQTVASDEQNGILCVDVAAVNRDDTNFIDIILISPTHDAIVLQIDADGRIVGIPDGFEGDLKGLYQFIFRSIVDHFQNAPLGEKGMTILPKADIAKMPSSAPIGAGVRRQPTPQSNPPIERSLEEVAVVSKPPKRKTNLIMGTRLMKQKPVEESQVAEIAEREHKTYIRIPFETISGIPEVRQNAVKRAVRNAEKQMDEFGYAVGMEELKDIGNDVYRIKAGKWRIAIQKIEVDGKTKWEVVDVSWRTDTSYAILRQKLGAKRR